MKHLFVSVAVAAVLLWSGSHPLVGDEPAADFFEGQVRPLLIRHCQDCHGGEKQESGLRLTSRQAALIGGASGPAIVPGKPEASLLMEAVRYEGLEMPPSGPLDPDAVAILERWVRDGAIWPESAGDDVAVGDQEAIAAKARSHWAFQPIVAPQIPVVRQKHLVRNPVDAFVLARQEAAGLAPVGLADPRTLIRRLSFDLIGLPPSAAESDAFAAASASGPWAGIDPKTLTPSQRREVIEHRERVYAELVDRLLASSHYGERWGRHWLDVARYADTRDFIAAGADRRYPFAWTYRDWVVDAFNRDLPYDEFIRLQLAADAFRSDPDSPDLAAMGLLTVGPRFINKTDEQIADRIDVVGRGFLGLTLSCARCHDHKYDPIPTADYYGLHGVFASCEEPETLPTIAGREPPADLLADYERQRAARLAEMATYADGLRAEAEQDLRRRFADYLAGYYEMNIVKTASIRKLLSSRKLSEMAMTPLAQNLDRSRKSQRLRGDPLWGPLFLLLEATDEETASVAASIAAGTAAPAAHPLLAARLAQSPPPHREAALATFAGLLTEAEARWQEARGHDAKVASLSDESWERVRLAIYAEDSPLRLDPDACMNASRLLGKGRTKIADLERAIKEVDATHPGAPPRSFVLVDRPRPVEPYVFLRGERDRRGPQVTRHFPAILGGGEDRPFREGSGRKELAEAIVDLANPLTSRVFVNRVWAHHFGQGLVATPSDFGLRAESPSHPELLDWLSAAFIDQGWSVKALHRLMVMSRTYRLAAARAGDPAAEAALAADPDNRLLCRANRRRIDFEAMRDAMLMAAGRLDRQIGGRPVPLSAEPFSTRRTIYGFIDRLNIDPMYTTFDFASPDVTAAQRPVTTVPQQALFAMNSPFVIEQSRAIARRAEAAGSGPAERASALVRLVYGRPPQPREAAAVMAFAQAGSQPGAGTGTWHYGWGDPTAPPRSDGRFRPLPFFDGKNYQASATFPDPALAHVRLSDSGAHPGKRPEQAVIRRWIAPADLTLAIEGELHHLRDRGDGVRGRIVHVADAANDSAESHVLGDYSVFNDRQSTAVAEVRVRQGDLIDFVLDCGTNASSDASSWAVRLLAIAATPGTEPALSGTVWDSSRDFAGPPPPPLSAWEQVAQALLLTNEFWFID